MVDRKAKYTVQFVRSHNLPHLKSEILNEQKSLTKDMDDTQPLMRGRPLPPSTPPPPNVLRSKDRTTPLPATSPSKTTMRSSDAMNRLLRLRERLHQSSAAPEFEYAASTSPSTRKRRVDDSSGKTLVKAERRIEDLTRLVEYQKERIEDLEMKLRLARDRRDERELIEAELRERLRSQSIERREREENESAASQKALIAMLRMENEQYKQTLTEIRMDREAERRRANEREERRVGEIANLRMELEELQEKHALVKEGTTSLRRRLGERTLRVDELVGRLQMRSDKTPTSRRRQRGKRR